MAVNVSSFPPYVAVTSCHEGPGADRGRCTFSRERRRWTLQGDCVLASPLDLPSNVTLDGGGHVIALTGDADNFESAAVRACGGDIINLVVDGSQVTSHEPTYFAAVALVAPGRISNSTLRNIRFDDVSQTAIGLEVAAFDNVAALVQSVVLENIAGAGILLTGDSQVSIKNISSSGVTSAVQVSGSITANITGANLEHSHVGVLAQDQSCVRISACTATGANVAEDQALIHQGNLTFIGAGQRNAAERREAEAAAAAQDRLG